MSIVSSQNGANGSEVRDGDLRLEMTVIVGYETYDTPPKELARLLENTIGAAMSRGLVTGETDALVTGWGVAVRDYGGVPAPTPAADRPAAAELYQPRPPGSRERSDVDGVFTIVGKAEPAPGGSVRRDIVVAGPELRRIGVIDVHDINLHVHSVSHCGNEYRLGRHVGWILEQSKAADTEAAQRASPSLRSRMRDALTRNKAAMFDRLQLMAEAAGFSDAKSALAAVSPPAQQKAVAALARQEGDTAAGATPAPSLGPLADMAPRDGDYSIADMPGSTERIEERVTWAYEDRGGGRVRG